MLLVVAGVLVFASRSWSQTAPSRRRRDADDEDIKRPDNSPLLKRLLWRLSPPHDVMRVDGLVVERTGKKSHCLWLGPTGSGKSAAVATTRVDGVRPTLVVTPDLSDPMIEATLRLDGFRWTACTGAVPIDFLIGSPTEVAERLTEVFRSGGTGAWKRAARRRTADVIRFIDASQQPRSLTLIGTLLREATQNDRELKQVCAGWIDRFLDLADQFGPSIASGGEDIAELLCRGRTVLLDNDAFRHPSLGADVVALGLAEAARVADLVPGGFRLVFEEAGQLGERIDLADPFFRAGRRRRIAVDALSQAESDFDKTSDALTSNAGTRVYFAQELKSLQKVAADRLEIDHSGLSTARMADYTAWVSSGKIRRLVKFPKPPTARRKGVSVTDTVTPEATDRRNGHGSRMQVIELSREVLPALPPPGAEYTELLRNIYRDGECERWNGKHDRAGHMKGCAADCKARHEHRAGCAAHCAIQEHLDNCYGLVWWPLAEPTEARTHEWQRVHRVRWRMAYGPIPLDPATGRPLTIDHRRTCPKDCSKLEHLNGPVTRSENARRSWRVGRA